MGVSMLLAVRNRTATRIHRLAPAANAPMTNVNRCVTHRSPYRACKCRVQTRLRCSKRPPGQGRWLRQRLPRSARVVDDGVLAGAVLLEHRNGLVAQHALGHRDATGLELLGPVVDHRALVEARELLHFGAL